MWEVSNELVSPYLQSCKDFSSSQKAFNNFRRDKRLYPILEHVTYEEGMSYLKEIKDPTSSLFDVSYKIKENDLVGNPFLYDYPDLGFICPTTLRYVKNAYDIGTTSVQRSIRIENIVEIGGGYGGLCRIMNALFPIKEYLLIDLEEVNQLSEKYLQYYFGECTGIAWVTPDDVVQVKNIELCISNYCFSECDRKTQQMYYDKIIKNSNMFYITYNHISNNNMSADEFKDFASKDFYIYCEEEVRDSHTNIIMYGYNRDAFSE
jgi:hypothetical protein